MSKSTVAELPDDLKAALDKLLRRPRTTIDEATVYINELIANAGDNVISRSAVGRYKKRIDEEGKRFREATAIAKAITKEYDEDGEAWRQEYELLWVDEATSWLPYDLIAGVEHERAGRAELYAGVLGVRKRAVSRLQAVVEAAEERAEAQRHAAFVQVVIETPEFESMVYDLTDALGKGYSAVEIMWDMRGGRPTGRRWGITVVVGCGW